MDRRFLLDAADVYPLASAPENRLTEIFAEVLRTSPQLLRWLAAIAFPTDTEEEMTKRCVYGNYNVETQFSLGDGRERPDIRVRFLAGPAAENHVFYIEDKLGAGPTDAQIRGYAATKPSPVILVHPGDPPPWLRRSPFTAVTWTDVAREAFRVGHSWARHASEPWPGYALTPHAPSEYRVLAELCRYLEREIRVTVPRPILDEDLQILPQLLDTRQRWDALSRMIKASLARDPRIRKQYEPWDGRPLEWSLSLEPDEGWPALRRHWETMDQTSAPPEGERWMRPSVIMSLGIPWNPEEVQTPAVGAGIGVHVGAIWPPGLGEGEPFRRAAKGEGFTFGTTAKGTVGRVIRTMTLASIAHPEKTLDEQADEIVAWTRDALAVLRTLDAAPDAASAVEDDLDTTLDLP